VLRNVQNYTGIKSLLSTACSKMFNYRTKSAEDEFVKELEKQPDSLFKSLLTNDKDSYLPSVIDTYYHRGILTSNPAEEVFSVLKRESNFRKHSLLTVLNGLMKISQRWITNSMNERIDVPVVLMNLYNARVGSFAINYIIKEMNSNSSMYEECNCLKNIYKLPCRHQILQDFNVIFNPTNIPKEYYLMKEDLIDDSSCLSNLVVREKEKKLKPPPLDCLIKRSKKYERAKPIFARFADDLLNLLKEENDAITRRIYNPSCSTIISKNCNIIDLTRTQKPKVNEKKGEDKSKEEKKPKKEYYTVHSYF